MGFRFAESEKLLNDLIQGMKIRIEQENRYYDTHHVLTEPYKKQRCLNEVPEYLIELCSGVYEIDESLPNSLVIE